MADTKITALAAITTVDPAADVLPIVDISDTSMAASGTTKKITSNQILGSGGTATLASATITGDLTAARLNVTASTIPANGVYLVTTNKIGFSTNSIERLNIDATGNLTNSTTTTQNGFVLFNNSIDGGNLGYIGNSRAFITGGATSSIGIRGESSVQFSIGANLGMTLNSTGLGVGASPSQRLHVKLDQNAYTYSRIDNQNASSGAYAALMLSASGNSWGIGVGSAAANSNALDFFLDAGGANSLKMRLDASGILMVGTTNSVIWNTTNTGCVVGGNAFQASRSDDVSLLLNRLGSNGKIALFARQGGEVGDISVTTTGTTFNSTSDYRLKEAVAPLSGGLARVNALKPSIYNWKSNGSTGEGFLAHELAEVVPAAVTGEKDAVNEDGSIKAQSIDMSRVVPILVAAIQELTAEVNALKKA